MARLENLRHEAFAQLVELLKWTKTDAYEGTGYERDRSNAADFAEQKTIALRRRQLVAEREDISKMTGAQAATVILQGAMNSGDWSPAMAAAKAIGEADGSFSNMSPDRRQTPAELRAECEKLTPALGFCARLIG